MIRADLNHSKRFITIQFLAHVDAVETEECLERVKKLLAYAKPGIRVLTDLSGLESMDASCAPSIGMMMDFLATKEIAEVVRVVPNPQKDIGFDLMSHFHYGREVRTTTVENLAEAIALLAK